MAGQPQFLLSHWWLGAWVWGWQAFFPFSWLFPFSFSSVGQCCTVSWGDCPEAGTRGLLLWGHQLFAGAKPAFMGPQGMWKRFKSKPACCTYAPWLSLFFHWCLKVQCTISSHWATPCLLPSCQAPFLTSLFGVASYSADGPGKYPAFLFVPLPEVYSPHFDLQELCPSPKSVQVGVFPSSHAPKVKELASWIFELKFALIIPLLWCGRGADSELLSHLSALAALT
jgi:hypothetical protein